jgi:hypothetical protein
MVVQDKETINISLIPQGKYCNGCLYLDTMLHYNCQAFHIHVETDGKTSYIKTAKCLESLMGAI